MNIRVREAKSGDESAIVALIHELGEDSGYPSPLAEDYVRIYLATPGCQVLLAEERDRVVGLLSYSVGPDLFHAAGSALIEELVVHGMDRGRGVGSALLSELLRRAAALGCVEVSVTTMPDNEAGQRLYRKHGLVDEAVFFEKHLP
jgi:ribosomal protein S18 acetylase RimI-like enzyme